MIWTCAGVAGCGNEAKSWAAAQRHADAHEQGNGHGARIDCGLTEDLSQHRVTDSMAAFAELLARAEP